MYSDRRGNGQNLPDKRPSDTSPGQKPPRTIQRICTGGFCLFFCTRPNKNRGGGPRCVTYFRGVPGWVTKWDRGGGKNWTTTTLLGPVVHNGDQATKCGLVHLYRQGHVNTTASNKSNDVTYY